MPPLGMLLSNCYGVILQTRERGRFLPIYLRLILHLSFTLRLTFHDLSPQPRSSVWLTFSESSFAMYHSTEFEMVRMIILPKPGGWLQDVNGHVYFVLHSAPRIPSRLYEHSSCSVNIYWLNM